MITLKTIEGKLRTPNQNRERNRPPDFLARSQGKGWTISAWRLALGCLMTVGGMHAGSSWAQAVPVDLGVPNAAAPAFSPDGKVAYVGARRGTDGATIYKLTRNAEGWSPPEAASFADGKHRDLEPVFAPDGSYLIFASNRPTEAGQADLDGHYNGKPQVGKGGALWRVNLVQGIAREPEPLPSIINSIDFGVQPFGRIRRQPLFHARGRGRYISHL